MQRINCILRIIEILEKVVLNKRIVCGWAGGWNQKRFLGLLTAIKKFYGQFKKIKVQIRNLVFVIILKD
jgi:hypothetical protein